MENLNFGNLKDNFIKKTIDNSVINESHDKLKKEVLDFVNVIKESEILTIQNDVFYNLSEAHISDAVLTIEFIKENLARLNKFTEDEIINENQKLQPFYNKEYGNIIDTKLNNVIHEAIVNKDNITKLYEAYEKLLTHIQNNEKKDTVNDETEYNNINEDILKIAIDKFNERYKDSLNEDEISLFNLIVKNGDNNKIFNEFKNETLILLENVDRNGIEDKINETIEKINNMTSDVDNIIKLHGLKKNLC